MSHTGDFGLEALLDLDGQVFVIDQAGRFWVKFVVKRTLASPERPHGLSYSMTLHGQDGRRLLGFDNAHPVRIRGPAGKRAFYDHKHRGRRSRPYVYEDALTLLSDFWSEVDAYLKSEGITP